MREERVNDMTSNQRQAINAARGRDRFIIPCTKTYESSFSKSRHNRQVQKNALRRLIADAE